MNATCPFCSSTDAEVVLRNALWYARWDRYPITQGHLLIVPFRHEPSFLSLSGDEQTAALELPAKARLKLDSQFHPDGYNVGINIGEAAAQTVAHAHMHVIPRYNGDAPDPSGGIRWVIPSARYQPR